MSKYTCAGQGELGRRLNRGPGAGAPQRGDKETLCLVGRPDVRSAAVGLEEEIASGLGRLGQCLRLRPVFQKHDEAPIKHFSNRKLRELGSLYRYQAARVGLACLPRGTSNDFASGNQGTEQ
jgi:hypothetical protein